MKAMVVTTTTITASTMTMMSWDADSEDVKAKKAFTKTAAVQCWCRLVCSTFVWYVIREGFPPDEGRIVLSHCGDVKLGVKAE